MANGSLPTTDLVHQVGIVCWLVCHVTRVNTSTGCVCYIKPQCTLLDEEETYAGEGSLEAEQGHRTGEREKHPALWGKHQGETDHGNSHACPLTAMDPPHGPRSTQQTRAETHTAERQDSSESCVLENKASCILSFRVIYGKRRWSQRSLGAPQQTEDEPHSMGTGASRPALGKCRRKAAKGFPRGGEEGVILSALPRNPQQVDTDSNSVLTSSCALVPKRQ